MSTIDYSIPEKREVVQIVSRHIGKGYPDQLVAVCNDGTMWRTTLSLSVSEAIGWVELPRIPQS